ncbi:MAG: beta-ketoacyl-ACP synthase 3, partial [Bacteroidia bacterium]
MSKIHAAITGIQGYVPDYILTNQELEKMVDTTDEWIMTRTGIKERHILKGEGKATSDMAVEAIKGLLEKTNTKPEEVELVIFCTVTPDMIFPATANIVCDKVGMKNAWGFDLSAACSGFLFGLTTGSRIIESGAHKKVIVVGADKMSAIVDYTDRTTCVIFGDGCGAVMLEPTEESIGIMDSILRTDGSGKEYLHQKAGGS